MKSRTGWMRKYFLVGLVIGLLAIGLFVGCGGGGGGSDDGFACYGTGAFCSFDYECCSGDCDLGFGVCN